MPPNFGLSVRLCTSTSILPRDPSSSAYDFIVCFHVAFVSIPIIPWKSKNDLLYYHYNRNYGTQISFHRIGDEVVCTTARYVIRIVGVWAQSASTLAHRRTQAVQRTLLAACEHFTLPNFEQEVSAQSSMLAKGQVSTLWIEHCIYQ